MASSHRYQPLHKMLMKQTLKGNDAASSPSRRQAAVPTRAPGSSKGGVEGGSQNPPWSPAARALASSAGTIGGCTGTCLAAPAPLMGAGDSMEARMSRSSLSSSPTPEPTLNGLLKRPDAAVASPQASQGGNGGVLRRALNGARQIGSRLSGGSGAGPGAGLLPGEAGQVRRSPKPTVGRSPAARGGGRKAGQGPTSFLSKLSHIGGGGKGKRYEMEPDGGGHSSAKGFRRAYLSDGKEQEGVDTIETGLVGFDTLRSSARRSLRETFENSVTRPRDG